MQSAVNDGSWTYARNATAPDDDPKAYEGKAVAPGAEYLFDRRVDPGENANLLTRELAEAERLRGLLDAHLAERDEGVVESGVRIDPRTPSGCARWNTCDSAPFPADRSASYDRDTFRHQSRRTLACQARTSNSGNCPLPLPPLHATSNAELGGCRR